jgi:hypothetical protein
MKNLAANQYFWYAIYLATWLILCMPVVLNDYPVMTDFINHLSRQYIRYEYNNVPAFQEYYSYKWMLLPNLATDIVISALLPFFNIYTAGKIFVCLSLGLWLFSSIFIQKLFHGKADIMPLLSALIAYNCMITWGFSGSLITIPLALICFALWIYTDQNNMKLSYKIPLFIILTFIIYIGHLFIFLILGMLVGSYELNKWFSTKRNNYAALFKSQFIVSLSFSAAILHFIYFITQKSLSHGDYITFWSLNVGKSVYSLVPDQNLMSQLIISFLALVILDIFVTKKIFKDDLLKVNYITLPFISLFLCILFIPIFLLGVAFLNIRVPPLTILLFTGVFYCVLTYKKKLLLAGAILALVTLQSIQMTYKWHMHNNYISNFLEVTTSIAEGEKALIIYKEQFLIDKGYELHLNWHMASFLTIENHAYVTNTFKVMSPFFMTQPEYGHISPPYHDPILIKRFIGINYFGMEPELSETYFSLSPSDYDYLIIIGTNEIHEKLKEIGEIKASKDKITLLKINANQQK